MSVSDPLFFTMINQVDFLPPRPPPNAGLCCQISKLTV